MISRRKFLGALPMTALSLRYASAKSSQTPRALFGTNAGGTSKGIYIADWNVNTGEFGPMTLAAEVDSPTFIVKHPHPQGMLIVSVCEKSKGNGQVASFLLEPGASMLKKISRQDALGSGSTHVSIHPNGASVYVANYGGGSVSSFHVRPDGSLSPAVSHFQYTGHGPVADRQEKPHAHSAQVTPDGRFLLVNDLGLDRIVTYRINASTAELTPHEPEYWADKPGAGPRHIGFHPNHRWVFNVNELSSTVDTLEWDGKQGALSTLSSVSILPPDYPAEKAQAARAGEIAVSKNGRTVYVNNRGHDSIAAMKVNPKTGALTVQQLASNGGVNTRHIVMDPTEQWLVACNQTSGTIAVLPRNRSTGKLSEPKQTYKLDRPMFTLFL